MQINKIQGTSFGECHIHKSANCLFDRLPSNEISNLFQKAYQIRDTKYWDLHIKKSNYADNAYVTYFINKISPLEKSFIGNLFPLKQEKNKMQVIAPNANPYSEENTIYNLKFETEERASEVYRFLRQTEPQKGEGIFDREFNIIHILEESYGYMNKPTTIQEERTSFFGRMISYVKQFINFGL